MAAACGIVQAMCNTGAIQHKYVVRRIKTSILAKISPGGEKKG
jgi:hypothetical protein